MLPATEDLVAGLFRRGFNPNGVVYVLKLLAEENPPGSERRQELEVAADYFKE